MADGAPPCDDNGENPLKKAAAPAEAAAPECAKGDCEGGGPGAARPGKEGVKQRPFYVAGFGLALGLSSAAMRAAHRDWPSFTVLAYSGAALFLVSCCYILGNWWFEREQDRDYARHLQAHFSGNAPAKAAHRTPLVAAKPPRRR
ncbi:hypothetical protein DIPPA_21298 [Diplonema papillatum]|nr:hypothetical protein DIPPA_21298 [Diplonema papillatum]|eukprot:gene20745-31963_t